VAESSPDFTARLREARADHEANVKAVMDGTAEAEVYAALEHAYRAADDAPEDLRDDARDYAVTLVVDAVRKARRAGAPVNPEIIGNEAAAKIRKTTEFMAKGGVLGAFRLLRSDTQTIHRIRSDLAEARRPLREPPELVGSPLAEWRAASEARSERRTDALEGLLRLAERQARGTPLMFALTIISAIAAVVAAVAAIIAL
jgi:hypothetical protein